MKIAVTATLRRPWGAPLLIEDNWAGAFRTAAVSGCAGIELHLRRAEDADARCIKDLMADYGLSVPTLCTGLAYQWRPPGSAGEAVDV